jgi:hypothetical protein
LIVDNYFAVVFVFVAVAAISCRFVAVVIVIGVLYRELVPHSSSFLVDYLEIPM